ncbi:mitochondrial inner membrane protein OXA1L-like isoform X2 [Limulus polyphemus]|uniref:Mitochondrial inner membrane protein OXA1L-like isoform X2 n=1 Tax=Limulus polyphemus TaxID=6850 RepID=A0ABM1SWF2_LIMPO|nr:mitochondrial inner membrane protein OXA1L-like isoform X2 [Limulus polyphemus]
MAATGTLVLRGTSLIGRRGVPKSQTLRYIPMSQYRNDCPGFCINSQKRPFSSCVLHFKFKLHPLMNIGLEAQRACLSTATVYHQETSSSLAQGGDGLPGYIPDTPLLPKQDINIEYGLEEVGSALENTGLGGWTPVGLVQNCFDYLHVTVGVPWWLSIVLGTLVVRTLMFPLMIKAQQNAAKLNNNLPQMQILQLKLTEARKSGNSMEAARYANELMIFMKEKDVNPLKGMLVPFVQAPIFISFFMALREMANLPLESMKTGGTMWFTDLTIPDPFYGLPLITCATLFVIIETGAEGGMRSDSLQAMRYFMRAMPLILFPFAINFPAAILCYWTTSNFISLGQVTLLKIEPVRKFFKIPKLVHYDPANLPIKQKGFIEGFKESMKNAKITQELEDRKRTDEIVLRKTGPASNSKSFSVGPTDKNPTSVASQAAKKR